MDGTAAIVLAAGAGSRFGGAKLLADLDGQPLLGHVLDRLRAAGLLAPVVVLPPGGAALDALVAEHGGRRVVNPDPARGLASSLHMGWGAALAADPQPTSVLVLLGDQPRVSVAVIRRLIDEPRDPGRPIVVPRYRRGGGGNPVRVEPEAAAQVAETSGDRGLGPVIAAHPELVRWLDVDGANPDVDTPEDLARLSAT